MISASQNELTQKLGRSPTVADNAAPLGTTAEQVLDGLEGCLARTAMSLSAPAGWDDYHELGDTFWADDHEYEAAVHRSARTVEPDRRPGRRRRPGGCRMPRLSPTSVDLVSPCCFRAEPAPAFGPDRRERVMASTISSGPPRVQPDPIRFPGPLLDDGWWPESSDLDAELRFLVPVLDQVRGPVTQLVLSAESSVTPPQEIRIDDRTVTVRYVAGQSPSVVTVHCADGGTFTVRMTPPGTMPGATDQPAPRREEDTWEAEGGGLGPRWRIG